MSRGGAANTVPQRPPQPMLPDAAKQPSPWTTDPRQRPFPHNSPQPLGNVIKDICCPPWAQKCTTPIRSYVTCSALTFSHTRPLILFSRRIYRTNRRAHGRVQASRKGTNYVALGFFSWVLTGLILEFVSD